jgi:hypothetical protein
MVDLTTVVFRGIAVCLILAGQVGLAVWFGADTHRTTEPGVVTRGELLAGGLGDFVGRTVVITGTAVGVDPVRIELQDGAGDLTLTLSGLKTPVSVGDRVRVRGEVTAGGTVRVTRAFAVPQWGIRYVWSVSALAGLWVLVRLVRGWRVDTIPSLVPVDQTSRDRECE